MSTPLSSLKKVKKIPLSSTSYQKNVDQKKSLYLDKEDAEKALYAKLLKNEEESKIPKNLLDRISELESKHSTAVKELTEKDIRIRSLEEKVKSIQEKTGCIGKPSIPGYVLELEEKCQHLEKQVQEMEAFLSDYGLIWVGDDSNENLEADGDYSFLRNLKIQNWKCDATPSSETFEVNYDAIIKSVKELNVLVKGGSEVSKTPGGATFKDIEPLLLVLYQNGLILNSQPFRPFSDPSCQLCIRDIMDGFFPSEIQSKFPEGIPFKVIDKRFTQFRANTSLYKEDFPGVGLSLIAKEDDPEITCKGLGVVFEHEYHVPPMTLHDILQKIPKKIVHDGKIINLNLQGDNFVKEQSNGHQIILVDTPVVQEIKHRLNKDSTTSTPKDITTLRIKSESGEQTYLVKMKYDDTIGTLRQYLDHTRRKYNPSYDIVSTFPFKVYKDQCVNFKECGLIPNATLYLRAIKSEPPS